MTVTEIKLCGEDLCTGCMACYNKCIHGAIDVKIDDEGFFSPAINKDKCIKCGLCVSACPILNEFGKLDKTYKQCAYKGWAQDSEIVATSSSGGIFSLLSDSVLSSNGYVYGAAFDDNFILRHCCVHSRNDISKLRGSKYVQSYIGDIYVDIKKKLDEGRNVLFCGTPCQVSGLNYFLKKIYPNLLTVDLVCHGVPSPKVFKAYSNWLKEFMNSEIVSYNFRDKKWSWKRFNSLVSFKNNVQYIGKWEEDPWMRGFLRNLFLRPSCHHCKFSNMNRQGDITLADYWSYTCKKGEIDNKDTGCSLILLNSIKGHVAFNLCCSKMFYYPISIDEARKCNPALNNSFPENPLRNQFWKDFNSLEFSDIVRKYMSPDVISLQYRYIYKYGRDSKKTKAVCFFIRLFSALKYRIRRFCERTYERYCKKVI